MRWEESESMRWSLIEKTDLSSHLSRSLLVAPPTFLHQLILILHVCDVLHPRLASTSGVAPHPLPRLPAMRRFNTPMIKAALPCLHLNCNLAGDPPAQRWRRNRKCRT